MTWSIGQGKTRAIKRTTQRSEITGREVTASADNPEYIVESEKSGKRTAHKRSASKKS